MNYKISLAEMDRKAEQANSKKRKISLEDMRRQVSELKSKSLSKNKKKQSWLVL